MLERTTGRAIGPPRQSRRKFAASAARDAASSDLGGQAACVGPTVRGCVKAGALACGKTVSRPESPRPWAAQTTPSASMTTYAPRPADATVAALLEEAPGLLVLGPRATGQTTTTARFAQTIVRLDRESDAAAFRADPDVALAALATPVLLDEWQVVPAVLGAVCWKRGETARRGAVERERVAVQDRKCGIGARPHTHASGRRQQVHEDVLAG